VGVVGQSFALVALGVNGTCGYIGGDSGCIDGTGGNGGRYGVDFVIAIAMHTEINITCFIKIY